MNIQPRPVTQRKQSAVFVWPRRGMVMTVAAATVLSWTGLALANVITPLTSYEPSETDLTVTRGGGDLGLTVSVVQGGVSGAPTATDGDYVLKVDFVGETDRKVEFRHDWSASTYDLDGEDELLADVYIATSSAVPGLMGIWSSNWDPPGAWQQASGIPSTTGVWTTGSFNVGERTQTGLNQIWAFILEDMAGATGSAYVDNLRFRRITGLALPWAVRQAGFQVEIVATGFQLPVNIAFVPDAGGQNGVARDPAKRQEDPFFYVAELYGTIKVVTRDGTVSDYATGLLNFDPTGQFPGSGEQGLAGIVVEPQTGDVLASVLYDSDTNPGTHYPKVVLLASDDGGLTAATQTTILDMVGEAQGHSHQISNLTIGPDGKLYVHMGDGDNTASAQNLDSFRGKILRMNLDGSPTVDNPFYDAGDGISARDYVYAYGVRNPFGGAWRAADGFHYEVENGPSVDRFAKIVEGRNYLWDGSDASMSNYAIYNWAPAVAPVNIAFVQAETFGGSEFPADKMDRAFVSESGPTYAIGPQSRGKRVSEFVVDAQGDLVSGPTPLIEYIGTGKATVVALTAGPDGLYFSDFYKDRDYTSPTDPGANVLRVKYVGGFAIITPLTSYEPSETDLTVTPGGGDLGLTVSVVQGGVSGAPTATDGDYVLKVDFVGETDRKVEFRHDWSASTYDLDGEDELLADVYIATSSAVPGLMGIWSPNWDPPDAWQQASGIPSTTGVWTTVSFNVAERTQTGLDQIWAFILEDMAGDTGTAYVDNLRFLQQDPPASLRNLAANAYADHVSLVWHASEEPGLEGYNIYRAESETGPFTKLNTSPHPTTEYRDDVSPPSPRFYYYVAAQVLGVETDTSDVVSALYNGLTDDQLMDMVQEATFRYFWDGGHPVSGMAREGIGMGHPLDTVATGGTGMGLMTMVVAAERGFEARSDVAKRVLTILTFLDDTTPRYHGAWSHHYHGVTGATLAFAGAEDNGGDLVETAFLVQGLLTVRQYFDHPTDPVEAEIRTRATSMWEGVEWDWYRQFPASDVLYWHWSPDFGWFLNHQIRGYNEAQIVYLLAIASPTHPMPVSSYFNGWAGPGGYVNGNSYYGLLQWVGPPLGGPLFFTHYSYLGFDPRYKRDTFANYFDNSRNISLIHHAYCEDNPNNFKGYSSFAWGLTASFNPFGYSAHSPTNDNGTITPTAAISAMPFTPEESLAALRHYYDVFGAQLWGSWGFFDAFNPEENWFANGWIAIDQGTIVPMIENYRTGLCWNLFMSNPEIRPALDQMGWLFEEPAIPTVSGWGLVVMMLLLLVAATVLFGRRGEQAFQPVI